MKKGSIAPELGKAIIAILVLIILIGLAIIFKDKIFEFFGNLGDLLRFGK